MGMSLLDATGAIEAPSWDDVEKRVADQTTFWLDLEAPDDASIDRLTEVFGFHRLAIDHTREFNHRAKLVVYDSHAFVVAFGATDKRVIEVHCYYKPHVIVTVRLHPCPAVDQLRKKAFDHEFDEPGLFLLYRLLDSLANSFPPVLDQVDDRLIELEDAILDDPDPAYVSELTALKREITRLRRAVVPGRDTLGGGTSLAIEELPGMTDEARRYVRDLYDHLVHVADQVDTERDHAASVMDVYMTTVNNRQNDVMKQLTAVFTIFLPFMFLTGFFGMNFPSLIRSLGGWPAFVVYGLGLQLVSVVAVLVILKRRGWF